jgi:hypothetical protein
MRWANTLKWRLRSVFGQSRVERELDAELRSLGRVALVVVMATAAAALIPSLRTTRIDPSRALRVD